jgi:hypothetical protein
MRPLDETLTIAGLFAGIGGLDAGVAEADEDDDPWAVV